MTEHTPGPWNCGLDGYTITGPTSPTSEGVTCEEFLEHNDWKRNGCKEKEYPKAKHTPITVGKRTLAVSVWSDNWEDEGKANARLIASAPELLAVCEKIYNYLLDGETISPNSMAIHELAGVITKAKLGGKS